MKIIIGCMCDQQIFILFPGEEEERTTQVGAEIEQKADKELEETKKTCSCCSEETEDDGKEKTKKVCLCRRESSASSEDSVISPDKVHPRS